MACPRASVGLAACCACALAVVLLHDAGVVRIPGRSACGALLLRRAAGAGAGAAAVAPAVTLVAASEAQQRVELQQGEQRSHYWSWIQRDLAVWRKHGITKHHVDHAHALAQACGGSVRVQVVNGSLWVTSGDPGPGGYYPASLGPGKRWQGGCLAWAHAHPPPRPPGPPAPRPAPTCARVLLARPPPCAGWASAKGRVPMALLALMEAVQLWGAAIPDVDVVLLVGGEWVPASACLPGWVGAWVGG